MQTQTLNGNLFANVKAKETAKKPEKKIVKTPLGNKIARFMELKNQIEASTGEMKMLEGDIKTTGKDLYLKQYQEQSYRPESFKLQDETGAACMLIVMDKYTVVDETKAEILRPFGLLSEQITYKINPELVDKYGQVISDLILSSNEISDSDKCQLIYGEKTFAVKKGSIDRLLQFENPAQVFELINPIVALKK